MEENNQISLDKCQHIIYESCRAASDEFALWCQNHPISKFLQVTGCFLILSGVSQVGYILFGIQTLSLGLIQVLLKVKSEKLKLENQCPLDSAFLHCFFIFCHTSWKKGHSWVTQNKNAIAFLFLWSVNELLLPSHFLISILLLHLLFHVHSHIVCSHFTFGCIHKQCCWWQWGKTVV